MKPFLFFLTICLGCPQPIQSQSLTLEAKSISFPTVVDTSVKNWNAAQPGYNSMNEEAKELYYWTNYARVNPRRCWDSLVMPVLNAYPELKGTYATSLKNDLLLNKPLPFLSLNASLLRIAQSHADDIKENNIKPGHVSTDGRTFSSRFKAIGLSNCGGENISFGDTRVPFLLVLLYLDYNLPGLGHRKALLSEAYTEIGIGAAPIKNNQKFFVQDFACTQTSK